MNEIEEAVRSTAGDDGAASYRAYLLGCASGSQANLVAWCRSWTAHMGPIRLPFTPQHVCSFVRALADQEIPLRPQSINHMLRYISDVHVKVLCVTDPTKHILVTSEIKALYRERGSRTQPIAPLRLKGDVVDIVASDPLPGSIIHMLRVLADDQSGWALRARVILGLGADTGRDRSDYVRLNVGDIVSSRDGGGHALFGRHSSDQGICEAPKFVSPETMGFIREWLEWREKATPRSTAADAPMLVRIDQKSMPGGRLSVWGYVDVLKDIMQGVGCGTHVSGNSFRAGLKLDLEAIGTTRVAIANSLGYRNL